MVNTIIKTLRLKIKPSSYTWLQDAAREVNDVWNWANATSFDASDRNRRGTTAKFLSGFGMNLS